MVVVLLKLELALIFKKMGLVMLNVWLVDYILALIFPKEVLLILLLKLFY